MLKKLISKDEKMKAIIYFFSAYIIPWILFPWIKSDEISVVWVQCAMTFPATGIILGKWYVGKEKKNFFQKVFVLSSLCYMVYIVFCIIGIVPKQYIQTWSSAIVITSSVLIFFYCILFGGKELYPFKDSKKAMIIVLFVMIVQGVMVGIGDNAFNIGSFLFFEVTSLFSILILSCISFLGEEYAWRGHLQKRLLMSFGKRRGVILLGIVWEIWHIPFWFRYFRFDQLGVNMSIMIILRFVNVIGIAIFLGWVYMKTENVWLCALLHGMNNQIEFLGTGGEIEIMSNVPIGAIIQPIILWMFIFSKEYNKSGEELEE